MVHISFLLQSFNRTAFYLDCRRFQEVVPLAVGFPQDGPIRAAFADPPSSRQIPASHPPRRTVQPLIGSRTRDGAHPSYVPGRQLPESPAPQVPGLCESLRSLPRQTIGIALEENPLVDYAESAVTEDRALVGSNPSAVTTRGHEQCCGCPALPDRSWHLRWAVLHFACQCAMPFVAVPGIQDRSWHLRTAVC